MSFTLPLPNITGPLIMPDATPPGMQPGSLPDDMVIVLMSDTIAIFVPFVFFEQVAGIHCIVIAILM